jgi:hypothetical protein
VQQALLNFDGTVLLIFYSVQDSKTALIKLIVKATPGNYHSVLPDKEALYVVLQQRSTLH